MGIPFHRIQWVTNLGFTWQYKQRVPKTQNRQRPSQQWLAGFLTEPGSYFFRRAAHANGTAEQESKKVRADPRLCLKHNCHAGGGTLGSPFTFDFLSMFYAVSIRPVECAPELRRERRGAVPILIWVDADPVWRHSLPSPT
jgi:hypothetical protein